MIMYSEDVKFLLGKTYLSTGRGVPPPPYIKVGGGGTPLRYWVLGTGDTSASSVHRWEKVF